MIYILITLIILNVLIILHELGHFLAAKKVNVGVTEFSIGMGPKIFSHQGKETLFSIRLFPIGGFCSLYGESEETIETVDLINGPEEVKVHNDDLDLTKSYFNKTFKEKLLILAAGVFMNFLTGYIVIYIALLLSGFNVFEAFPRAFRVFFQIFGLIFYSFKMLFSGEAGVNDLTGPIGLVKVVEETYSYGFINLLIFTAMISINLGIVNLLPIPALDGGQIVMISLQRIKKGFIKRELQESLIVISYILLIGLAVFVAYNDINRIFIE